MKINAELYRDERNDYEYNLKRFNIKLDTLSQQSILQSIITALFMRIDELEQHLKDLEYNLIKKSFKRII